ncbi:Uncharacterized conserved protein [Oligella urethralis]|uniref:HepT-like ribonuclease domain-containing protein n=1 Tax=Oligella urethralis TaxID=90245 RepID=UPI000E0552AD|nr:HepT-like ribonuclease domain-containing protein [Oligella urethralis]SUA61664.1 Uncharacterized conserved protein [Oligella urethralis]
MSLNKQKSLSYLQYMQQAIDDILEYTNDLTYEEFVADKPKRQATQLNFIILGENAARLLAQKDVFDNEEEILKLSKTMRNFITHQYESVNLALIYATAKTDIPELKIKLTDLAKLLNQEPPDPELQM